MKKVCRNMAYNGHRLLRIYIPSHRKSSFRILLFVVLGVPNVCLCVRVCVIGSTFNLVDVRVCACLSRHGVCPSVIESFFLLISFCHQGPESVAKSLVSTFRVISDFVLTVVIHVRHHITIEN